MNFYIVFGSTKRPTDFMGGKALDWGQPPIGVYRAEDALTACQAAARDHGTMATYFAVQGFPWGVDLLDAPATQLGRTESSSDRMARILERMERNDRLIEELERQRKLEPTREERIAAAEARSRDMEREAGIGDEDD